MFFVQEGFTYRNFLLDALAIFVFIVWFWLLITVASDLFRRHDISGWTKALWVIVLVVAPYIGVFAYLIFQGRGTRRTSARGWL
jgi:divalent metal cation (Fe/Co/Zn/Cd) transporter